MLLLASTSAQLIHAWKPALLAFDVVLEAADLGRLKDALIRYRPDVVLLDAGFPDLGGQAGIAALREQAPRARLVVLADPLDDEQQLGLFELGVRGIASPQLEADAIGRLIRAVGAGELWIRRDIVARLVDRASSQGARRSDRSRATIASQIASLTERERQIAALVGSGESNKQIARLLDISERTVKAHLTEIFRKLGVDDRLKLALLVTTASKG